MFKKYTSEEIIAGLMPIDNKVYQYLDRLYRPKVIAYVCKNLGSREDGEDLYQNTIIKVCFNIEQGKYDPKLKEFGAYFMGSVRNIWLNELRKRSKSPNMAPIDVLEKISDTDEAEQEEQQHYYRDVQKLLRCIAELTKEEQEMIHLFYFAKKSLDFIAKKMNIAYSYARLKICRIRDKLRKMMEDPDLDINRFDNAAHATQIT